MIPFALLLAVTFAAPQTLPQRAPTANPAALALGDFNGDGRRDIAVGYAKGSSTLIGNTNIGVPGAKNTARDVSPLAVAVGAASVALGDLDGDGVDDWCFTNPAFKQIQVIGGGSSRLSFNRELPQRPLSVRVADIDGDGKLDLIVGYATSSVSVIRNLGGGSFASTVDVSLGGGAALAISDVSADGALDLIAGAVLGPRVYAANGSGAATFTPPHVIAELPESASSFVEGLSAKAIGLAIAIRDGALGKSRLYVLRNGEFGATALPLQESGGHLHAMFADVDRDGTDDLVVADSAAGVVTIYGGNSDRTWPIIGTIQLRTATVGAMVAGDVSGDGVADLVVASSDGSVDVYVNTTPEPPRPRRRTVVH